MTDNTKKTCRCTQAERELVDRLYKDHPELKNDLDFDGWYCDWQEIIGAIPKDIDGYSQSPMEMIRRLIDQRDALVEEVKAQRGIGGYDALRIADAKVRVDGECGTLTAASEGAGT